ncbi:conserved exported hypothetical protein [Methylocella tundrae]|uniref:Lipoprotein n=1 Tax=Methylocella tundrae TaxID=227605 RepID=A0A8B6M2D4_METTU|nr:hypothetical protein [Methylocella tundrae]VTZ27511.1 conserved exported hypothetical protein [Methylocella tundrae]VTZ49191.1 conserved exported hypothetical protein [Methylocella tundrae]
MGYIRGVSLFAAVLTAGACCEATISSASQKVQSAARARHDGVYAVDVFTHQGACDSVYHWTITVLRGRVSSPADGFMQASGEITPRGVVSLAFRRDNQVATVAGKVKGKVATGIWSSPTLQCAGSWRAVRQG